MKNTLFTLLWAIAAAVPLPSLAQDPPQSQALRVCIDQSGGVTHQMLQCIGAETQRQDARLNKGYRALMAQLGADRKKQLQDAQRAWIKYRDRNCDFYLDPEGGSLANVTASDCLMTMTTQRAAELEKLAR